MNIVTSQCPLPWQRSLWQQLMAAYQQRRLPHALLITGDEGLGKQILSHAFTQVLLCEKVGQLACGQCRSCQLFIAGSHPDLHIIEPEAGHAIKVDIIRELRKKVMQTAQQSVRRVVLINTADVMNIAASNGLLKILEEPPKHVCFVLVTSFPHRLLATIRSRCQTMQLKPSFDTMTQDWLAQQLNDDNVKVWLELAEGVPLKALQLANSEQQAWRKQCLQDLLALCHGLEEPTHIAEQWQKHDAILGLSWWSHWLTDAAKLASGIELSEDLHPAYKKVLQEMVQRYAKLTLFTLFQRVNQTRHALMTNTALNPTLLLESLFIDLFSGEVDHAIC